MDQCLAFTETDQSCLFIEKKVETDREEGLPLGMKKQVWLSFQAEVVLD